MSDIGWMLPMEIHTLGERIIGVTWMLATVHCNYPKDAKIKVSYNPYGAGLCVEQITE